MSNISWVHANCKFSAARREQVWAMLSEVEAAPIAMSREAGPVAAPAATGISQWDIVVVNNQKVGFSEDSRPFLVTRVLGGGLYEVCHLTTQTGLNSRWTSPGDFPISKEHPGFGDTNLRKPSIVMDQPMVVSRNSINRKVGRLSGDLLQEYLQHTGR